MGPAHFYQFEYYNSHHDTTFILTSACPDGDIGYDTTCVPRSFNEGVLTDSTMHDVCKLWEGYETIGDERIRRTDMLCYYPNYKHGVDYIAFNDQKRNLDRDGGQKPRMRPLAPGTCETLCQDNMGMPVLQDDQFPPSHQVEWTDLDDMCDGCE